MDRPPDIDTAKEGVPKGCILIQGTRLMPSARVLKIPYGVARHKNEKSSWVTDGILISKRHEKKWNNYQNR